jgi:hypothetical protein
MMGGDVSLCDSFIRDLKGNFCVGKIGRLRGQQGDPVAFSKSLLPALRRPLTGVLMIERNKAIGSAERQLLTQVNDYLMSGAAKEPVEALITGLGKVKLDDMQRILSEAWVKVSGFEPKSLPGFGERRRRIASLGHQLEQVNKGAAEGTEEEAPTDGGGDDGE